MKILHLIPILLLLLLLGCASAPLYSIQAIPNGPSGVIVRVTNAAETALEDFVIQNDSIAVDSTKEMRLSILCNLGQNKPLSETAFDLAPGEQKDIEVFCNGEIDYDQAPEITINFTSNYAPGKSLVKMTLPIK